MTDIVLNLKGIVCKMHSDATEVEAPLVVTGPGDITAKDIDLPAGVEILNPDVHIATLEKKTKLELYLTIGRGRGYRPAEENKSPDQPIGVIPIDSIFSPVQRVAYAVEQRPRRPAHRLRQAHARHRDGRLDRPARRAARGRRDPHRPARRSSPTPTASRSCARAPAARLARAR